MVSIINIFFFLLSLLYLSHYYYDDYNILTIIVTGALPWDNKILPWKRPQAKQTFVC